VRKGGREEATFLEGVQARISSNLPCPHSHIAALGIGLSLPDLMEPSARMRRPSKRKRRREAAHGSESRQSIRQS